MAGPGSVRNISPANAARNPDDPLLLPFEGNSNEMKDRPAES